MHQNNPNLRPETPDVSYISVIKELTATGADLLQSEMQLLKSELNIAAPNLTKYATRTVVFWGLFGISLIPLMAFAVIGLGILLNGAFWLSSLVVGAISCAVAGYFGNQAYQKLKSEDLSFSRTRDGIAKAVHLIESKIKEVKTASHGGSNEPNHFH